MTAGVDLLWLGGFAAPPRWPLGQARAVPGTPGDLAAAIRQHLDSSGAEAWLLWDAGLGTPDPERVVAALALPGDLWHAGLRLGMGGLPGLIDFVHPTWMLNRDADPAIEATSWRLSPGACLVRTEVLKQMGGPRPEFRTLAAAGLEMGHRYLMRGVLVRHIPWLVPQDAAAAQPPLPFEDEVQFALHRFGPLWARWALARAVLTGYTTPLRAIRAWRRVATRRPPDPAPFRRTGPAPTPDIGTPSVTVVIPTLERYPYLRTLLGQLRGQTVRPMEIVVVDQTPPDQRDTTLAGEFADLPLQVLHLGRAGQCSSRNAALQMSRGDYLLFLDDDDEVPPTLIESHLNSLRCYRADVSSGVAHEVGAGPLPEAFRYGRASDVFPTNNTLLRKSVLERSGLFDLAYERGQRADGDLGMRVYLTGALMVLNPDISVLHHHAPAGGLRAHGARVITYASSRSRLMHRHLPSVTELYLAMRYFTPRQVREMVWLRTLGTFSLRGSAARRAAKLVISLFCLGDTLGRIRGSYRRANSLLETFPRIPALGDPGAATAVE